MLRVSSALVAITLASAASADTATGSYGADFSSDQGNRFGGAVHTGQDGGGNQLDTLQLIGDYYDDGDGYVGANGTWTTGTLSRPNATGPISAFNASFKFAFNNNANGSYNSDGFSFLFGDLTDMSGDRWKGGEAGLGAFTADGSGMSVGFRTYSDHGFTATWGSSELARNTTNTGDWYAPVTYGHNWVVNDSSVNGGGTGGLASGWLAANGYNGADTMATAFIEWAAGGDLVVKIRLPGQSGPTTVLTTNQFANVAIGEDFSFGLAARIGGATWDVQIDDFNVSYTYQVPGVGAIAGLAGLGLAGRRRRR